MNVVLSAILIDALQPGIMSFCLNAFACALILSREPDRSVMPMSDPPSSIKAKAEWRRDADPVRQFADDLLTAGDPEYFVESSKLFSAWNAWREANGVKLQLTARMLNQGVQRVFPQAETGDTARVGGKRGMRRVALIEE